jgi:Antitoxin-like ribbon-helix-helix
MAARQNSLQAVLDRTVSPPPPTPIAAPPRPSRKFTRPSRDGTRLIAGHFTPAVAKQIKLLAVEEDTTVQALLEQALDLLFVNKGKGKIAGV